MELVNDKDALLDKVVVCGFRVDDIENMGQLISQNIVTVKLDKDKYIWTKGGEAYSSICIEKTELFDKFEYGLSKDGREYGSLQISVGDSLFRNLNCFSADDYRRRIKNIESFLYVKYKIKVIFDDAKYKSIEINKTIALNDYFGGYGRVLDLMVFKLPAQLRLNKENVFYRDKPNTNILKCEKVPETYSRTSGKKGLTIKIYDKSIELLEMYNIHVNYNYLRFEVKLNSTTKIGKCIGSNSIWEVNDNSINEYFNNFVVINIEKPYIDFCKERDKKLRRIIKKNYIPNGKTWIRDVFLEICNMEMTRNIPIMLSAEELVPLLDVISFSSRQCKHNAKRNIRKLAEEKVDVFNDNKDKYEEIIQKLK